MQWNCRGFKANFYELKILCERLNPLALCLQETFLRQTDIHHFKHYNMYNCFGPGGDRAAGGTAILVWQGIIHSHLQLDTSLQATAVRITLSKTITLCSIRWFPPGTPVSSTRTLISSSFHRLDMTLAVAEALNPNKPIKNLCSIYIQWSPLITKELGGRKKFVICGHSLYAGSCSVCHQGALTENPLLATRGRTEPFRLRHRQTAASSFVVPHGLPPSQQVSCHYFSVWFECLIV